MVVLLVLSWWPEPKRRQDGKEEKQTRKQKEKYKGETQNKEGDGRTKLQNHKRRRNQR